MLTVWMGYTTDKIFGFHGSGEVLVFSSCCGHFTASGVPGSGVVHYGEG